MKEWYFNSSLFIGLAVIVFSIQLIHRMTDFFRRKNFNNTTICSYDGSERTQLIHSLLDNPEWFKPIHDRMHASEQILAIAECLPIGRMRKSQKHSALKTHFFSRLWRFIHASRFPNSTNYVILTDMQIHYLTFTNGLAERQFVFYRSMINQMYISEVTPTELMPYNGIISGKNCKKLHFKADGERWEIIFYKHILRSPFQSFAENPFVDNQLQAISSHFSSLVQKSVRISA